MQGRQGCTASTALASSIALSPPPTTASGWSRNLKEGPSHTEHAEMPLLQKPCFSSEPLNSSLRALAPVQGPKMFVKLEGINSKASSRQHLWPRRAWRR